MTTVLILTISFVEYETEADLAAAVEQLDGREFKGTSVRCISDVSIMQCTFSKNGLIPEQPQSEIPRPPPRERYGRSRSPPPRRGYGGGPPHDDYYDRRGPPRGYSPPRRDDYRRRSPPPRDYYDRRGGGNDAYPPRSPPRARGPPPADDYAAPPRRAYADDPYGAPPPPRRYDNDPYANGHGREPRESREPYGRPPSPPPRRDRGYEGGSGGGGSYDRRGYW